MQACREEKRRKENRESGQSKGEQAERNPRRVECEGEREREGEGEGRKKKGKEEIPRQRGR
eukprot:1184969-Pleurochrysis_carterae.AAC.1